MEGPVAPPVRSQRTEILRVFVGYDQLASRFYKTEKKHDQRLQRLVRDIVRKADRIYEILAAEHFPIALGLLHEIVYAVLEKTILHAGRRIVKRLPREVQSFLVLVHESEDDFAWPGKAVFSKHFPDLPA